MLSLLQGCTVGPPYHRPAVPSPPAFKEADGWKVAQPKDETLHGDWWRLFNDPQLDTLERQVNVSNQNIATAFAAFLQARALVKEARAQYYPTLTVAPSVTRRRLPPSPRDAPSTTSICHLMPPGHPIFGVACATPLKVMSRPRKPARRTWKTRA
jgi:outer membrane protein TolC